MSPGYWFTARCGGCEGGTAGPCRSIIEEDTLCYGYAAGSFGACPIYMRPCTDAPSVGGVWVALLSCSACPGTRWDARLGEPVEGSTCSGHGTCDATSGGVCECDPGWAGRDCSERAAPPPASPCDGRLCNGRGVCVGAGECACQLGWSGVNCTRYLDDAEGRFAALAASGATASGGAGNTAIGASAACSGVARRLQAGRARALQVVSGAVNGTAGNSSALLPPPPPLAGEPVVPAWPCESSSSSGGGGNASAYRWHTTPWSRCSVFCGASGTMTRNVTCRMLAPAGSALARIRGDGTVNASLSSPLLLGSDDAGSGYEFDMRSVWEDSLCAGGAGSGGGSGARPADSQACNAYACPTPLTNVSTAPALLYLSFPALLSSPALGPGSPSRAAFLDAVAAEVSTLLARLGLPASVSVSTSASSQLNVSLVPSGMAWVDLDNVNGTDVMLQLLSEAAVRAFYGGTGSAPAGSSRLRRLAAGSGGVLSASAVAHQLSIALESTQVALLSGLTLLPQAASARWVTMTPDTMPGLDPSRLVASTQRTSGPSSASWRDDPKSVGGLAAGVTAAGLLIAAAAAALLVVRLRRRKAVKALAGKLPADLEPQFPTPSKPQPEHFEMANPGMKKMPRPQARQVEAPVTASPNGSARILGDSLGHSSRRLPVQPVLTRKSAYVPESVDGTEDPGALSPRRSALEAVPEEDDGRPRLMRQGSKLLTANPMASKPRGGGSQAL